MDVMQPISIAMGGLTGAVIAGAGASWWWSRRLGEARRQIDRLRASRELLDQQNSQARRQVEQLHLEMTELRLLADRERRRVSNSSYPADVLAPPTPAAPVPDLLLREREVPRPHGFAQTQADEPGEHDADGPDSSGFMPTQIDRSGPR